MQARFVILSVALFAILAMGGCSLFFQDSTDGADDKTIHGRYVMIEATAYCPCGHCCDWQLNWLRRPVHSSGKNKGKAKAVGITASGKKAKPGTLAADTKHYPMGTVFYIPGYGYGVVEDRGGDIKGKSRLDLYYNTHKEAKKWGRQKLRCVVFPPGTPPIPKNAPPPR